MNSSKKERSTGKTDLQALREQAFYDIASRTGVLTNLTDGRNVEGFSAMRAVGKYVIHSIISETEFTALFYEAYQKNGLLQKIGHNTFAQTVKRALAGCRNEAAPKLRKDLQIKTETISPDISVISDTQKAGSHPKPFRDRNLMRLGYNLVDTYQYYDLKGKPVYQKLRYQSYSEDQHSKQFLIRHQKEDGIWYMGRGDHQDYPYHLPDMISNRISPVLVCEGEKDADTARSLGFLAISINNWSQCISYLDNRDIILIPDNDGAGRKKANSARQILQPVAHSVHCLELPGLNEKEDLTDWVQKGGTGTDLQALIQNIQKSGRTQCTDYQYVNGKPVINRHNVALALCKLGISLSCNQLTDTIELSGLDSFPQFSDLAVNRMRYEISEKERLKVHKETFYDFVVDIAQQNAFHPIENYLSKLSWDGTPRVETFFIDIAGAEDTQFNRRITQIWFTAAVRRIFEPGTDFQELIVIEGK